MRNSIQFNSIQLISLLIILLLGSCSKDIVNSPSTETKTEKQSIQDFLNNFKNYKKGDLLLKRTEETYTFVESVDYLEEGLNMTYCDGSRLFSDESVAYDTFSVPMTGGLIEETDLYGFYDDALEFASFHFYGLEEENKVPKAYDITLIDTVTGYANFQMTSIVDQGDEDMSFTRKEFTGFFSYFIDGVVLGCSTPSARDALKFLKSYGVYNLRGGSYSSYFYTDFEMEIDRSHHHSPMWLFECKRDYPPPYSSCCVFSCIPCNAYDNNTLIANYCLDTEKMNYGLYGLEYSAAPELIPSGKSFTTLFLYNNVYCSQVNNGIFGDFSTWLEDIEIRMLSGTKHIRVSGTEEPLPEVE